MDIVIERFNYASDGTFGRLRVGDLELFTCEQPWNGNTKGSSCIPEGMYELSLRSSPIVQRTSGGEFDEGWEVTGVFGRTYIMIHPANWPHELQGCIAPGMEYQIIAGKQGVTQSRKAFKQLMDVLNLENSHTIHIIPYRPQYP